MNLHPPIQYITLVNTKGAIKKEQSRETGVIGYTSRRRTNHKKQHNMCWISLYTRNKTNTNKIKKNTQHNMCWTSLYTGNKTNTNKIRKKHTTQYVLDITIHRKQDEYKQN